MLSVQAERVLPYPCAALFDLAADMEQYPRYLAGWISAWIYERQADVCYAEQVVGFGPVHVRFRSKARLSRPQLIEVTSDDTQFERFHLVWRFEPSGGSGKGGGSDDSGGPGRGGSDGEGSGSGASRVTLSVELELRSRFLQRWIDRLAPAAASEILFAFEQHARQVLRPPAPPTG